MDAVTLNANTCFDADVYSSYETLPSGVFENPDNFDLVNWIINQNFIGQESPSGQGIYTFGDVQWAIWELIDDENCVACTYIQGYDVIRAQEIVAAAIANGEGFVPSCDQYIAIILVPTDNLHPVCIPYYIPCREECDETAWAAGCPFPGNNWATYFMFDSLN